MTERDYEFLDLLCQEIEEPSLSGPWLPLRLRKSPNLQIYLTVLHTHTRGARAGQALLQALTWPPTGVGMRKAVRNSRQRGGHEKAVRTGLERG